jgi:hypothetical protein
MNVKMGSGIAESVTGLGAKQTRNRIAVLHCTGPHLSSNITGTEESFLGEVNRQEVKLTVHFHIVSILRMTGKVPPFLYNFSCRVV